MPSGDVTSVFDAAMKYQDEGVPLIVLAGAEYGTGSSRDWAAKGTTLLGVRAVIARSYERIHRSNLIGMGVLPLQFIDNQSADTLGFSGDETFTITGIDDAAIAAGGTAKVIATKSDGSAVEFDALIRLDTPVEVGYYKHGGILPYVLRELAAK